MEIDEWRNSFIICEVIKNNIDIDFENLNLYNEKEVLFLFLLNLELKKFHLKKKWKKSIYNRTYRIRK